MIPVFIPTWALLGLCASFANTAIPLVQEKYRANGFALAVTAKAVSFVAVVPFMIGAGLPQQPQFYLLTMLASVLWAISDVIYFKSVPLAGAGVISRLLPSAVIISFLLWFLVDPALLDKYLQRPIQSLAIASVIAASAFFATRLKKCQVSLAAIRLIWFVIFAACVGPLLSKLCLNYAPGFQGSYALSAIQSFCMICCWAVFYMIKRPVPMAVFKEAATLKAGILIGLVMAVVTVLKFQALQSAEHPAYISVLLFTDALWILLYHKATGRKDGSNIWAGLGIVACAAALVLIKSF